MMKPLGFLSIGALALFAFQNCGSGAAIADQAASSNQKTLVVLPLPANITSPTARMADLWPTSAERSKSLLRVYDHIGDSGTTKFHLVQKTKWINQIGSSKFVAVEDWVKNGQGIFVWVSTWYLRVDLDGTVTEYADSTAMYDAAYESQSRWLELTYLPGKEIKWGGVLNIGDTIENPVEINSTSKINFPDSTSSSYPQNALRFGYNKLTYVKDFADASRSGSFFTLYQTFCGVSSCAAPDSWEVWVNYYMTPGLGIVRMDYHKRDADSYTGSDRGSHVLAKSCEVSGDSLSCP
jgi:hypothetical protein